MYKRKKGIDSKNSFLKITNGKGRICQRNMQATPGNVDRVSSLHELDNDGATMNVENTITQVNDVTNYNAPPPFFFLQIHVPQPPEETSHHISMELTKIRRSANQQIFPIIEQVHCIKTKRNTIICLEY